MWGINQTAFAPVAAALLAMLAAAGSGHAQQDLEVAATVPVASPTGGGARNLSFGAITPNPDAAIVVSVPAAIAPQSAAVHAGEFRLNVQHARGVTLELQTPASLTADGAIMSVSYSGAQYGAYCVDAGSGCSLTSFDPAATAQLRVCRATVGNGNCHPVHTFPANSQLSVFIGGALTVLPGQRPGVYTGTVTLTITQVH